MDHNCEHFATWCRFGDEMSKTVDELPPLKRFIGHIPVVANLLNEGDGGKSRFGCSSSRR